MSTTPKKPRRPGPPAGSTRLRKVNGADPTPKYVQTRDILMDAIRTGRFTPGDRLPSTSEISAMVDVSLITAQRALEGLVELGWVRREVGRGTYVRDDVNMQQLGQQRLSMGLVLPSHINIGDFYHSTLINALRREALSDDCMVDFFFHERFDLTGKAGRHVGALCLHPPEQCNPKVLALAQRVPTVVVGGASCDQRVSCVDCDNTLGARLAVQHLIEHGHRRVVILSGPTELSNARDRVEGALSELAENGVSHGAVDVIISRDSVVLDDESKRRLTERLTGAERPTAVFAGGFYLALEAIQVVRRAGLAIPAGVSIVGFDDPPSAPLIDPPLTTVRQPLAEMAVEAYRLLRKQLLTNDERPRVLRLPTELIVRGSTGPVPGGSDENGRYPRRSANSGARPGNTLEAGRE